ncbi:hypothetical protein T05_1074 [Trichinella murrelli]|uniref:Uncharacterized protein n=1 Tax=Trichinella murrelli TaxID=144512 RepID=A0A0V0UHT1_9BILA|nr:hypothetical protein T05_1074 [Trichinella murrelli]
MQISSSIHAIYHTVKTRDLEIALLTNYTFFPRNQSKLCGFEFLKIFVFSMKVNLRFTGKKSFHSTHDYAMWTERKQQNQYYYYYYMLSRIRWNNSACVTSRTSSVAVQCNSNFGEDLLNTVLLATITYGYPLRLASRSRAPTV